jgi:glutamate-1-semialdehyde 2,1-aminomutase
LWFAEEAPYDFATAKKADAKLYAAFYRQMRDAGVYLAPSAFETAFTSFAHSEEDYARTLEAARKVRF